MVSHQTALHYRYHKGLEQSNPKQPATGHWYEGLSGQIALTIPQMTEGLVSRKIRWFYIFGKNLVDSEPDIRKIEHELSSAVFLVCQAILPTETTRFAHLIFPAAVWSQNDGTIANSERRVSRVRTASPPPGLARPNWWISKRSLGRWGMTGHPIALRNCGITRFPFWLPALWQSNAPGSKMTGSNGRALTRSTLEIAFCIRAGTSPAVGADLDRRTGPLRLKCRMRNIRSHSQLEGGSITIIPEPRPDTARPEMTSSEKRPPTSRCRMRAPCEFKPMRRYG
jgi:Molybdopterin oxidoreductase